MKKEIDRIFIFEKMNSLFNKLDSLVINKYEDLPAGIITAEQRYGDNVEEARKTERQIRELFAKLDEI